MKSYPAIYSCSINFASVHGKRHPKMSELSGEADRAARELTRGTWLLYRASLRSAACHDRAVDGLRTDRLNILLCLNHLAIQRVIGSENARSIFLSLVFQPYLLYWPFGACLWFSHQLLKDESRYHLRFLPCSAGSAITVCPSIMKHRARGSSFHRKRWSITRVATVLSRHGIISLRLT